MESIQLALSAIAEKLESVEIELEELDAEIREAEKNGLAAANSAKEKKLWMGKETNLRRREESLRKREDWLRADKRELNDRKISLRESIAAQSKQDELNIARLKEEGLIGK